MPSILERIGNAGFRLFAPREIKNLFDLAEGRGGIASVIAVARQLGEIAELDEPGWLPLMPRVALIEMPDSQRIDAQRASEYYWQRDVLMGRAVQLTTDYTFGRGVAPVVVDPKVKDVITSFWDDPRNKKTVSTTVAQWKLAARLILHGEIFFVLFVNTMSGQVVIRIAPVEEITEIISHPEDAETPLYYQRSWQEQKLDLSTLQPNAQVTYTEQQSRIDYIPDWENREGPYAGHGTVGKPQSAGTTPFRTDNKQSVETYIFHLKVNSLGQRGIPMFYRALVWIKAFKGFMEDRATITLAQATFAFKQKIKGGTASVARMIRQWGNLNIGNRYATGEKERREGAQVMIEGEGATLEPWKQETSASQAYTDGRMLRCQVAAGVGITEPDLTGDPSVGNLASLSAMNAPMLKGFESNQQIWADALTSILDFVIEMAVEYGPLRGMGDSVDRTVRLAFPPIVTRDLNTTLTALAAVIQTQTQAGVEFLTPRRYATELLSALGETNIEAILEDLDLPEHFTTVPESEATPERLKLIERELEKLIIEVAQHRLLRQVAAAKEW
ncbi:MAG: hypothetical protein KKC55_16175 [Gammaproteobacteria bacterium]|nr:hypothetical protein [Gammaproteobacteria bacterium]